MCRHQNETLPDTAVYRKERGTNEVKMNSRGLRSQLKDSVPVAGFSPQGAYGVQDSLRSGFTSVKNELLPSHPLELSEKNFQLNQDKMNFSTLRNIQGLHAPLKLQMEYRAARQIQRLPFLQSSNLALDTLRNSDESIGFEDVLNDPAQSEVMEAERHRWIHFPTLSSLWWWERYFCSKTFVHTK
uniref:Proteasome maturation protein n=1 Tax=Oreochromis niloticus TaxID=8128 RepID=A0A669BU37_ORENI